MRFNVHNGEGPYSHPDVVSPAFLGALTPKKPHFPSPNLATKDLRDLLKKICALLDQDNIVYVHRILLFQ